MNLDDLEGMRRLDTSRMIDHINTLPDQVREGYQAASRLELPGWGGIDSILLAGMGGSAISGDLLSAFLAPSFPIPVIVHRDYGLPAWVSPEKTLVVCSSHSGNTEETISSLEVARSKGCRVVCICTGGKLAQVGISSGFPVWKFQHDGQPRSAIGFGFTYLMVLLSKLGLLADPGPGIEKAIATMNKEQAKYLPEVPASRNPAKRQAGQMVDRNITLVGAGMFASVARRWKGQINELAKAPAAFDTLPEADHNSLAGTVYPEGMLARTITLFLESSSDSPATQKRVKLTKKAFMLAGIATDSYIAAGVTPLEQIWSAVHFGDYVAYYLSMLYGVDPTPIEPIQNFKKEMID